MNTRNHRSVTSSRSSILPAIFVLTIFFYFHINGLSQVSISNFESAAGTPVKQLKNTFSYGAYFFTYEGNTEHVFNEARYSLAFSVYEQIELKLSYSLIHGENMENMNMVQLTPKYSGPLGKTAFKVGIGIFIRQPNQKSLYRISPRILITAISMQYFNLTFAPAFDVIFGKGVSSAEYSMGLNLGLGFSSQMDTWSVRPEIGLAKGISKYNSYGIIWSPGLAFTYTIK